MMGMTGCVSVRPARAVQSCRCAACPGAPGALVLPPLALEPEQPQKKPSKMKVLKKIKKKMGLAPRAACGGGAPNNLPPLSFHRVHGENVRLSRDAATARRVESFCKGVAFSARPVRVNEKVCLRFADISNNWSGVLRFGFTSNDPAGAAHGLPKYACPDLTNKPGYWAKALAERLCEKDSILFYYVTAAGDVHYGVDGEEKGVFFGGVETRGALWALLDIYGNCTAVQFCDARARAPDARTELAGALAALAVDEPPPRYRERALAPLALHRTRGRNVRCAPERGVAARVDGEFCQGYVFAARPMRVGETLVVQVLATEPAYAGSLAVGLTSCDPATLRAHELPDDADALLDRPEYWVVRRDAAAGLRRGDELAVTLAADGEVRVSRDGAPPAAVMHVDHTLRLWAFVDVYGATQKVRLLGAAAPPAPAAPPPAQLRVQLAGGGGGGAAGGTVLVVSLPPHAAPHAAPRLAGHQQPLTLASAHYIEPMSSQSQLCLTGLQPAWSGQELACATSCATSCATTCATTSQNDANTSQQAIVELHSPAGERCAPPAPSPLGSERVGHQVSSHGHQVSHPAQGLPYVQLASLAYDALHSSHVHGHSGPNMLHSGQNGPHTSHGSLHSGQNVSHGSIHSSQNVPHSTHGSVHSSLNAPHTSHSSLHSGQNVQHSTHLIHSGQNASHTSHGSLHSVQNAPHSNHVSVHSGQSAPHTSHVSVHSSQNTPHSTHGSVHSGQNAPHSSLHSGQNAPHTSHGPSQSVAYQSQNGHSPLYEQLAGASGAGAECTICYENPVDSVLYMCGHMCMCYRCAVQQWRGKGGGQCPLCRATIKDVIRTYKS